MLKPLQPSQPITLKGDRPSHELVIVIQMLVKEIEALQARVAALE